MDRNKCTYFIQLLIVFGSLVLIDGQYPSGYGRRGVFLPRRSIYPRYPVDPYEPVRRYPLRHYPDPYIGDTVPAVVRPTVVVDRRPTVVDSSAASDQHTNVVNNNINNNVRENSGNVNVHQSTGQLPRCTYACESIGCPPYYRCSEDSSCRGGRCRASGGIFGAGHVGHVGGGLF